MYAEELTPPEPDRVSDFGPERWTRLAEPLGIEPEAPI